MYEKEMIELLSKFVEDGAGDAYLKNGMSDLYIDYREAGELKDSDDLRELAEFYAETGGNLIAAVSDFLTNTNWWFETELYYADRVESACSSFIDNLTMADLPSDIDPVDNDGEILSDSEIIEEIQNAYYERIEVDRWGLFEEIGYDGVDMEDAVSYFPSEVKVDISFGEVRGGYYYGRLSNDESAPKDWYVDKDRVNYGPLSDFMESQGINPQEFLDKYVQYANYEKYTFSDSQEESIVRELENGTLDNYPDLFAAAKISLEDYCKLAIGMADVVTVLPSCYLFGLFNQYNGSGASLEIEIKSPFTHKISGIQVDMGNARGELGYTIDEVHGLVGSAYAKNAIVLD